MENNENKMSKLTEKEVAILNTISEQENISQRKISNNVDISVGMVNIFLKKLVKKGLIKIKKTSNKKSLKYILTTDGFSERFKYNMYYLKKNLQYFSNAKKTLLYKLTELADSGIREIYIHGTDDWSEIIYLTVKNFNFNLLGFVNGDTKSSLSEKLDLPILTKQELIKIEKPTVLLANLEKKSIIENSVLNNKHFIRVIYF
jgi:DNA-binding MarR family transcriptional regulator